MKSVGFTTDKKDVISQARPASAKKWRTLQILAAETITENITRLSPSWLKIKTPPRDEMPPNPVGKI